MLLLDLPGSAPARLPFALADRRSDARSAVEAFRHDLEHEPPSRHVLDPDIKRPRRAPFRYPQTRPRCRVVEAKRSRGGKEADAGDVECAVGIRPRECHLNGLGGGGHLDRLSLRLSWLRERLRH